MLGVDRLDMVKGIPQKLLAYEKFLEEHPEWRDKVCKCEIGSVRIWGPGSGREKTCLTLLLSRNSPLLRFCWSKSRCPPALTCLSIRSCAPWCMRSWGASTASLAL